MLFATALAAGACPLGQRLSEPWPRPCIQNCSNPFEHSRWDSWLSSHVGSRVIKDGVRYATVNYGGDHTDLYAYLDSLCSVDLSTLSQKEYFALMMNAYNAGAVRLIIEHCGDDCESISSVSPRWDRPIVVVGGRTVSLLCQQVSSRIAAPGKFR
mmetsp:Transcript_95601/g.219000  ORF Transcript_95601/g.219000 Transcript_95601/m.219000 type:complete len:155 (+) Transcript_95601:2085-2549(+)